MFYEIYIFIFPPFISLYPFSLWCNEQGAVPNNADLHLKARCNYSQPRSNKGLFSSKFFGK